MMVRGEHDGVRIDNTTDAEIQALLKLILRLSRQR